ncbi:MAG: DUF559 domain-containing protein [Syntrophothermus sp.]
MARRQHGVVARWQLIERGMGRRPIEERLRLGRFHLLHRGVYAVGHRALGWDGTLMAAVLAGGRGAVLSHRSAAQAWGLVPRRAIDVEVTKATALRGRAGIRPHQAVLHRDELGEVDGIPVTSVARTLLDIAPMLDRRQLERAWNEMEVRGLTHVLPVRDLLERHRGRRGCVALRRLVGAGRALGRTRSELEERFARLLDAHGLPRPRLNAAIAVRGRFFEVDALWARQRLAVELDGAALHGTPRAFHADRERDRILLAAGYRTARITWDQLRDEAGQIAADLRSARSADRGTRSDPACR